MRKLYYIYDASTDRNFSKSFVIVALATVTPVALGRDVIAHALLLSGLIR